MKLQVYTAALLLFSLIAYAQPYKAKVVYKDGQVNEGFLEEGPSYKSKKIKLKDADGKALKIKTEDLLELEYTEEGEVKKYVAVPASNVGIYIKGETVPQPYRKGNCWLKVEYEGKELRLLSFNYDYSTLMALAGEGDDYTSARNIYFLQKPAIGGAEYIYDTYISDGDRIDSAMRFLEAGLKLYDSRWKAFLGSLTDKEVRGKSLKSVIKLYDTFEPDDEDELNVKRL